MSNIIGNDYRDMEFAANLVDSISSRCTPVDDVHSCINPVHAQNYRNMLHLARYPISKIVNSPVITDVKKYCKAVDCMAKIDNLLSSLN